MVKATMCFIAFVAALVGLLSIGVAWEADMRHNQALALIERAAELGVCVRPGGV
jgi:hypothetical protein